MSEVETDARGRVTIPKEIRDRLGDRYRLVELHDGVKLIPIPDDPVAALRDAGSEELKSASLDELGQAALDEGRRQAEENVR